MEHVPGREQYQQLIAAGSFCPPEKSMYIMGPLPKETFHPFEDQPMDLIQAMAQMAENLENWQKISRAESRFGERYIKFSRLVENAVTMLGRGLMTLHVQGKSMDHLPIGIDELWAAASFHFRKSYRGAKTALVFNPDAFMRLFSSQARWFQILTRLERTRDKLQQPVSVRRQQGPNTETGPAMIADSQERSLEPLCKPEGSLLPSGLGAAKPFRSLIGSTHSHKTAEAGNAGISVLSSFAVDDPNNADFDESERECISEWLSETEEEKKETSKTVKTVLSRDNQTENKERTNGMSFKFTENPDTKKAENTEEHNTENEKSERISKEEKTTADEALPEKKDSGKIVPSAAISGERPVIETESFQTDPDKLQSVTETPAASGANASSAADLTVPVKDDPPENTDIMPSPADEPFNLSETDHEQLYACPDSDYENLFRFLPIFAAPAFTDTS